MSGVSIAVYVFAVIGAVLTLLLVVDGGYILYRSYRKPKRPPVLVTKRQSFPIGMTCVIGCVLTLVALCFSFSARADLTWVCTRTGAVSGDVVTDESCGGNYVETAYLNSNALYFVCSGATGTGLSDCNGAGGTVYAKKWSDVLTSDLLGTWCCGYDTYSTAFAPGGGSSSSSSSSSNPWDVPDLTYTQWGGIVEALLWLFAIAAVVQAIRKYVL